jgi:hypothetical protein
MMFCLIHLDPPCPTPEDDEVYVVVPGSAKTAIALPLDALPGLLPVLEQAVGDLPPPQCADCGAEMPSLPMSSSSQNEWGQCG